LDGLHESMSRYAQRPNGTHADSAKKIDRYEAPFALLYSIADSDDSDTASQNSDGTFAERTCLLEGSLGIPEGHPAAPHKLELKGSQEGFIPG
jgi:hypothetical protein